MLLVIYLIGERMMLRETPLHDLIIGKMKHLQGKCVMSGEKMGKTIDKTDHSSIIPHSSEWGIISRS